MEAREPIEIDPAVRAKVLAGRAAVGAYRVAHQRLYNKPRHRGIPEEHTPLLQALVAALEGRGFTSSETDFEPKKTEILAKFWADSNEFDLIDTGIFDRQVRHNREDLSLIAGSTTPNYGVLIDANGIKLEIANIKERPEAILHIDGEYVTDCLPRTHLEMETGVGEGPDNAKVFIGGLGLGLVLQYLALSGKAAEVLICEIDNRIISAFGQRFQDWFQEYYPKFKFQLIQGDALREVAEHGKFDWIFFDLTKLTSEETIPTIKSALNEGGVYSDWWIISRNTEWMWR